MDMVHPLTYLYYTYRPGGIDPLANSLESQTSKNFELVVVDDWPGRVERGKALEYLRSKGIAVTWYGVSKPRTYLDSPCGAANAINTAFIHVRSPLVCLVSDYSLISENSTNLILANLMVDWLKGERFLVSGSAIVYSADCPKEFDDIRTWPE